MTVDVKGMGIREYLGQGDYWVDVQSGAVFQINEMDQERRVRAARSLLWRSTALIIIAEADASSCGDLVAALRLAGQVPRKWMIQTELYQALHLGRPAEIVLTLSPIRRTA